MSLDDTTRVSIPLNDGRPDHRGMHTVRSAAPAALTRVIAPNALTFFTV